MLTSSILNSITFKVVPDVNTYPNMWNTLHVNRKQGQSKVIPYFQKFQKDHTLYLQFSSDLPDDIMLTALFNAVEIEVQTVSFTKSYGTSNIRYYTNFTVSLTTDYYNKPIHFKAEQIDTILISEPILVYDLSDEILKGTVKYIQYTNIDMITSDLSNHFIDWSILSAGYLDMFIDAIDVELNDTDNSEVLEGAQYKTILSANYYSGKVLQTAGIPDYMVVKIGMISSLDVFVVNGIQYVKTDSLSQSRFGGSTLYQMDIKLSQKSAIGINVDNIGTGGGTSPIDGLPMWIGSVTSEVPTEAEVVVMDSISAIAENQVKAYTISGGRFCFAYPTSLDSLISITDNTGFEIISGFAITALDFTIDAATVNYTIYTLKSPVTVSAFTITYKFS